jgi:two-component system sensor histidine kinase/response regulator
MPNSSSLILIIDDQEDNLALLETVLLPQGFRVLTADSGAKGLALAKARKPDLILLDLAMPGMDGFAVLEALKSDPLTRLTPVIVLTANYREAAMVQRGFELGATEYLTKPIKMDELLVRLHTTLRLARAEQELDNLRRGFSAMLVHDLRAPMDGVKLAIAVLTRQEPADSPRLELLKDATLALDGMGRLVDDLLHVHQLETAMQVTHPRNLDLEKSLDTFVRPFRGLAEAKGVNVIIEHPAGPLRVFADAPLLERVMDNLISNALKFTEVGEIRVRSVQEGDFARISVADTGPGIAEEALPRIFDRFYHVARRQATRQGGFGLGLAFCEGAIKAMGGAIGVDSKVGQGSTFWFTIPHLASSC